MLRQVITTTPSAVKRRASSAARPLNSSQTVKCKVRVSQFLEQAQSATPEAYKTVKSKSGDEDNTARRNQLIWCAQHSLGDNTAARGSPLHPHEKPWTAVEEVSQKNAPSWEGVTVWPHLWQVNTSVQQYRLHAPRD